MSFMSFLKAFAHGFVKVEQIVAPVALQAADAFMPGLSPLLSRIVKAVAMAEVAIPAAFGNAATGQQKLDAAVALSEDAVDIANLVAGHQVMDNDKYRRGIEAINAGRKQITSGVADVMDALKSPVQPTQ